MKREGSLFDLARALPSEDDCLPRLCCVVFFFFFNSAELVRFKSAAVGWCQIAGTFIVRYY